MSDRQSVYSGVAMSDRHFLENEQRKTVTLRKQPTVLLPMIKFEQTSTK